MPPPMTARSTSLSCPDHRTAAAPSAFGIGAVTARQPFAAASHGQG